MWQRCYEVCIYPFARMIPPPLLDLRLFLDRGKMGLHNLEKLVLLLEAQVWNQVPQ